MNRAFLSDLAWHISLHPSCRAELRRHWPAPHYHKTPHDIDEAEEQPRCQATGASPPAAAVAGQDESKKSGGGGSGAFNPYETFSLRLKRKRREPVKAGCRSRCGEAALPEQQHQQTRTGASQAKAKRRISSNSASLNSTSSAARVVGARLTTSSASSLTRASKLSSSLVVTAKPAAAVEAKAKRATLLTHAAGATTAAVNNSKSTSAPAASSSALVSGRVKAKEPDEAPTSVVDDSASAAPATSKRNKNKAKSVHVDANDTKLKTVRSSAAATATGGPSSGPAATKKKKTTGNSISTIGSNAADSDNGSEKAGYIRDPLNIRLPHSPPYRGRQAAGRNGHRPVHVTIRWSGARQRRRRFFAQYPALAQPENAMYLQQLMRHARPSPSLDVREVAVEAAVYEEKRYSTAQEKVPHQGFAPPLVPRSVNFSDAATTVGRSAPRQPSTVASAFLSGSTPRADAPLQKQQKLCPSDREAGHTTNATAATGRRASLSSTGGRADARSHARMHGQGEDEEVASHVVASNASINDSSSGALPVRPFARYPPLKGTTILSQSTNTAARTLALSISGSEMPTPSSADNFSATLHSVVRRPNSLFIVRTPLQDNADEAAAYDSYYYSRQVGVAGNSSRPLGAMGPVGSHSLRGSSAGVASASGPNRLRVTYVTANTCSTARTWSTHHHSLNHSTDRGSSPYQPSSLAPANPSASQSMTTSGPSFSDPRPSVKAWINLDSPTLVNSAFSALQSPMPSVPSTPLYASAAAGPKIVMRSATIKGAAAANAGGGKDTPPLLNVKTVMVQRHRSFLLRRQQQQERSSPAPVGDSAPVAAECDSGPLRHFPRENSSTSVAAGTAASNPPCSDSQPRHRKLQQSSIISAPSPPRAPVPLGVAPGGVQPLAGKRATSAQHRARTGEGAVDEPGSSGGVCSRDTDGTPCHRTSVHAQRQSSHFSFTNLAEIGRTGELLKLPQQHSHTDVAATNQLSAESSLHLFATGEGGADCSNASSVQLTQQYLASSLQPMPCPMAPHTRRDSERDLQAPSLWHPVYTETRLYAASESTATPTGPHAGYLGNSNNFTFSEPATPLCWTQQRNSSGLVPSHQRLSSCSLASTPLLSHPHLHTPSFGNMGGALPQGARRTPSGLPRSPSLATSTATPTAAAPQVFCNGAIAEAEECSYYLSHERCSSASAMPGTSLTTSLHRSTARQSSPSPSPPPSGSPLCVVSLADCRAKFSHDAASASAAGDERNAKARWDEEQEESDEMGDEHEETTFGTPRFLFHIPLCCDDPYHRDEEALEMLSITTTSSCAFGAGLDGLRWQDWMPSSPLEAGEVMLRTVEQAAATATEAAASTHARDSNRLSTIADSNNRRIQDALGSGQAETVAGARAAHAVDSFVTGSATAAGLGAPNSSVATSSRQTLGVFADGGKVVSTDIAAPRNSEDLVCVTCRAMDSASVGGVGEGATDLHDSLTGTSFDFSNSLNAPGSGKRPFIAEWIVSKLQKRMEKKKQKMQRKQLEREAAAAETVGMGNPLQFRFEGGSESLPSPAGAPRAHSRTSSMSDYSDAGPPCGGYFSQAFKGYGSRCLLCSSPMMPTGAQAAQQHRQGLAYLAAAYQTELVIHEQKRREAEENRRGLEALAHVVTSPNILRPHAQPHKEPFTTEGSSNGVNPSGSSSYSIGSEEHAGDAAVQAHLAMSFWSPRIPEQGGATPPPPPLTRTSKAGKGRSNTMSQQPNDTTVGARAKTTAATSSSEATKLKTSGAAAPERQPPSKREHRDSKALAMASMVEAERMRVALDTVKTKKQAIESWIFGLRL
ncbi:hypothetical protein CGC21_23485 [Leishmania donovani]|uniref:Uncharacterized protein n=1 Tax=Leishmania donovani TaxID=5661 RepID=A0A504XKE2_LEIDO|nr:hypothetical protein CGC21_23485 [Leishmania donovani]